MTDCNQPAPELNFAESDRDAIQSIVDNWIGENWSLLNDGGSGDAIQLAKQILPYVRIRSAHHHL